jgi:alkane 1-monooxygenase
MSADSPHPDETRSAGLYLLSLLLPLAATAFLVAPVHHCWVALVWALSLAAIAVADEMLPRVAGGLRSDAAPMVWLADVVALLQIANFALFVRRVSAWGISADAAIAVLLVGVGSAFSSMISAHELIHRRSWIVRWLGRVLLWTVLYDHFFTEHLRGHHRTVGTAQDVLTARRGETFVRYFARSWPGEIRSAWRIAVNRSASRSAIFALAANEVAHGVAGELALLTVIGLYGGPAAIALVVAQAMLAHVLVGAVNYFEHWGILRTGGKAGAADAWDSIAPLSHYALLGLSFHADHHIRASRPFDRLELHAESPKLPHGYFAMVALVLFRGTKLRRLLDAELSAALSSHRLAAPV